MRKTTYDVLYVILGFGSVIVLPSYLRVEAGVTDALDLDQYCSANGAEYDCGNQMLSCEFASICIGIDDHDFSFCRSPITCYVINARNKYKVQKRYALCCLHIAFRLEATKFLRPMCFGSLPASLFALLLDRLHDHLTDAHGHKQGYDERDDVKYPIHFGAFRSRSLPITIYVISAISQGITQYPRSQRI
jgi:hypothetical protein